MPVLNRKRSRASGRVSGRRRTAHEQEDHDMDQDQEEEENEEEEEEAEEVPARRGRDQRKRRSSAQQQPATSQRSRVQVQGRRRQTEPEEEEQEDVEMDDGNNDGNGLRARKRRRRRDDSDDDDDDDDDEEEEEAEDAPGEKSRGGNDPVAKFVRFALACEYQKKPIRRPEITEKVLMPHHKNEFKTVFDETQKALRRTFGMELVELPANREKVSLKQQRRAAAQEAVPNAAKNKKKQNAKTDETATGNTASPSTSTSNTAKAWILTSILPEIYKEPDIIAPYQNDELALHGFGMAIVTLVYLSNRALNDKVLDRYLKRLKSEETIAVEGTADTGKTDNILVSLVRNGYLVKVKDDTPPGQEESFTYKIGPRGKVEVGKEGVRNMVKMIYGEEVPDNFDRMIARSIGLDKEEIEAGAAAAAAEREEDEEGGGAPRRAAPANNDRRGANQGRGARAPAGRGGRRRREEEEEDEDEDEDEEEDADDDEEEEEDEDGDDSE